MLDIRGSFSSWGRWFYQRKDYVLITFVSISIMALTNNYVCGGDGIGYFVVLETLIRDLDLDLSNQQHYEKFAPQALGGYPFGFPLLCAPLYLLSLFLVRFKRFQFENYRYEPPRGFYNIHTVMITFTSNIYALITLLLTLIIIKRIYPQEVKRNLWLFILLLYLSTPLFWTSTFYSNWAHAVHTGVITFAIYAWLRFRKQQSKWMYIVGLLLGLGATIHYTSFALMIPFIFLYFIKFLLHRENADAFRALFLIAGILSIIWSIPLYISAMRGIYPAMFYFGDVRTNKVPIYFFHVLFAPFHGIFVWHPLTFFSILGFRYAYRKDKELALVAISMFFALVGALGYYSQWWGANGPGQRFITPLFPIFAIGLYYFLSAQKTKIRSRVFLISSIVLTIYSLIIVYFYLAGYVDYKYGTPLDIMYGFLTGKITLRSLYIPPTYQANQIILGFLILVMGIFAMFIVFYYVKKDIKLKEQFSTNSKKF